MPLIILKYISIYSTATSVLLDTIGMNPIKDIISSLFVWPLASVGQFNETDFQWRHVLLNMMVTLPSIDLFDIIVGYDSTNETLRILNFVFII